MKDGAENLKIEIQVTGKSINELKAAQREIDNLRKSVAVGSTAFKEASKASAAYKNAISQAHKEAASANDKLMKSYFSTGEELRRFYRDQRLGNRTMSEAGQAVSGLTNLMGETGLGRSINTAFAGFQQAEFAVNGLGIAAAGAGGKLGQLGQSFLGLAGPITATIALLAAVAFQLDSLAKRQKAAKEGIFESLFGLGEISKAEYYAGLKSQVKTLLDNAESIKRKADTWASFGFKLIPSLFGISKADVDEAILQASRLKEKMKAMVDAEEGGFGNPFEMKGDFGVTGYRGGSTNIRRGDPTRMGVRGIGSKSLAGGIAAANRLRPSAGPLAQMPDAIKEARREMTEFESVAVSSLYNVGNTIGSSIGQGFVTAFGIGHTLLGQFLSELFSGLAAAGARKLFSLIPVIGPLFSGKGGGGGEPIGIGGGNIGSMTSRPMIGSGGSGRLKAIIKGTDIHIVSERAGRLVAAGRY